MERPEILNNVKTEISHTTEPKGQERTFKQYHQFLKESVHGAIFFKNLKSEYIAANNRTLELLKTSREQLIGKNDYEILSDKEAAKNIKEDRSIFKTGKPIEVTMHMSDAGGRRHWYHIIKFPQFDEEGNIIGLAGIARDITERKKTEMEHVKIVEAEKKKAEELKRAYADLQDSKDALIHTEKLAYTGRVAANIAHEIRNPLTNVSMSIPPLKKAIRLEKPCTRHLDIIEKNTERINYLITELLNCARPPKLNIRIYKMHRILKNVLDAAKAKIRAQKIKVVEKFTFKSSEILIDKEQIERAFLNIFLNAIEAMPRRGKLTIITEHSIDHFTIRVQDTGKGIPEKDIIRIFDPFFSSKPEGVGLGLTLCYGIIVSHGGTIEVESKLKKGTIFTVSLPLNPGGEKGITYG